MLALRVLIRGAIFFYSLVTCVSNHCVALTCPYARVYIAALPGKSGGCLSDQAGDYGRAVIETN